MVKGLDIFKDWFKEYSNQYVLIGGTATSLAMQNFGIPFRGTKDLDVVLHIEALTNEFGEILWQFIELGGYEIKQRSNETPRLYRFKNPKKENYPWMIELFSRLPDSVKLFKGSHLTPIPMGEEISNMSAILLDNDYYEFVISGRKNLNQLSWIAEDRLIPLKAFAWLNLTQDLNNGKSIPSSEIRKHLTDVIALSNLLTPELKINLAPKIADDLKNFIEMVNVDEHPEFSKVKDRLLQAYGLN